MLHGKSRGTNPGMEVKQPVATAIEISFVAQHALVYHAPRHFCASGTETVSMPPQEEEVRAEMEKIEQGAPIPPIEVSVVKRLWSMGGPLEPGVGNAVGTHELTSQQFVAQYWRGILLTTLIGRGVLRDYVQDEESMDKAMAAAATIPCNKSDVAEAAMLFHLTQKPPEAARKAKEELKREGFDADNPTIDGKFIQWMRR